MVQIEELRIGNYVFFDSDSFPMKVTLETFVILFKYPERIKSIKPINLNLEILERCGFELAINSTKHMGKLYRKDTITINLGTTKNNSVHKLQNLYYSLTGIELEVVW